MLFPVGTIFPIALNIIVSVSLIVINKALISKWNFDYTMSLTFLHFAFTGVTMHCLATFGVFVPKAVDASIIGVFATTGVLSIVFNNLTLQYNSVGFYQLAKLCCVPATVAVEYFYFRKSFTLSILLSLLVLLVGVSGATITDVEFNWKGFCFGVLGIIFTTWYQIWIGRIQSDLQLSQLQLLYAVSPWWGGSTFVMAILSDVVFRGTADQTNVFNYNIEIVSAFLLFFSCCFAVGVNFSGFLLVKVTSALTYMVIGHFKTMIVLSSSFVFFGTPLAANNVIFIMIAFIGFSMYGYTKSKASLQSSVSSSLSTATASSSSSSSSSVVAVAAAAAAAAIAAVTIASPSSLSPFSPASRQSASGTPIFYSAIDTNKWNEEGEKDVEAEREAAENLIVDQSKTMRTIGLKPAIFPGRPSGIRSNHYQKYF